jgi:hypothetical protein
MATKSIKHYGVSFAVKAVSQCTDSEGVDCCPKCGARTISLVHEECQIGLWGKHKYFVFNECDTCAHHYVLTMNRTTDEYNDR